MRGQKVFDQIVKSINNESNNSDGTVRRGRNNMLVSNRNECMLARYYYYGNLKNKNYCETLRLLVAEFYLSPTTIANVIMGNSEGLQALKQKDPTLLYFVHRWPHIKW